LFEAGQSTYNPDSMFNSISGTLTEKRADSVCIETSGIEWELSVPVRSVDDFGRIGDEARAYVWLHHYEDGMRLYGFPAEADRAVFHELMKVEGIGPKQAMRILSGIKPDSLEAALEGDDLSALQKIPGVGPKLASKMLLSLKGKIVRPAEPGTRGESARPSEWADVARALADMGYDRKSAEKAVAEAALSTAVGPEREREIFRKALLAMSTGR
jgi:holliday junction DNA helicase RuvA